jgi:hypothetical protein
MMLPRCGTLFTYGSAEVIKTLRLPASGSLAPRMRLSACQGHGGVCHGAHVHGDAGLGAADRTWHMRAKYSGRRPRVVQEHRRQLSRTNAHTRVARGSPSQPHGHTGRTGAHRSTLSDVPTVAVYAAAAACRAGRASTRSYHASTNGAVRLSCARTAGSRVSRPRTADQHTTSARSVACAHPHVVRRRDTSAGAHGAHQARLPQR